MKINIRPKESTKGTISRNMNSQFRIERSLLILLLEFFSTTFCLVQKLESQEFKSLRGSGSKNPAAEAESDLS